MKRILMALALFVGCGMYAQAQLPQPTPVPAPQPNQQQAKFAVVRINNTLSGPVTLYYRWVWSNNGNVQADWKKTVIPAGKQWSFWYTYKNNVAKSPDFFVRFDTDRQVGVSFWEYALGRGAAPDFNDPSFGAIYTIKYSQPQIAELIPISGFSKVVVINRNTTNPF